MMTERKKRYWLAAYGNDICGVYKDFKTVKQVHPTAKYILVEEVSPMVFLERDKIPAASPERSD